MVARTFTRLLQKKHKTHSEETIGGEHLRGERLGQESTSMQNDFSKLTDAALVNKGTTTKTAIAGSEASYGLLPGDTTALNSDVVDFNKSITDAENARAAAQSLTQDKDAKRQALLAELTGIAKKVYANPAVTNAMLVEAGFAPRSTTRTPIVPVTPANLVANAFVNGDVKLTWDKAGNKYGVVFQVEAKSETGDWTIVATTTQSKIALTGYAPGTAAWFRVRATKNGIITTGSNEVSIYHSSSTPSLQIAA